MDNGSPAISVTGLSHTYNRKDYAVNDVSFEVKRGEIFGLLGRNGAGKTTIIKILTTLIQPTRGEATVLGFDIRKDGSKIRKRVGVVQQETSFEFSTVRENFDLYGFLWGIPKPIRVKRREDLMTTFGLEHIAKMDAVDLSGGQKRRVQVAREFIHDMDLLFLDEPTVGLDPIMRRRMLDMLRAKAGRESLAILFTTHNLEEADYLCDRAAIIDRGSFKAVDTIDNLKRTYGMKKAIEVTFSSANGSKPPYDELFSRLASRHLDLEVTRQPVNSDPAVLVTRNPEEVIESIVEFTSEHRAKLEWLNIRKSTLEDVFFQTVSTPEDKVGNGRL